jgi:hypothetical protein
MTNNFCCCSSIRYILANIQGVPAKISNRFIFVVFNVTSLKIQSVSKRVVRRIVDVNDILVLVSTSERGLLVQYVYVEKPADCKEQFSIYLT